MSHIDFFLLSKPNMILLIQMYMVQLNLFRMRILINLYYLQSSNVLLISRQSFVVFCPACVRGQQVQLSHVLGHHPETKVLSIDGNSIIHNDYKKCY